jgi:hypothetical protein
MSWGGNVNMNMNMGMPNMGNNMMGNMNQAGYGQGQGFSVFPQHL